MQQKIQNKFYYYITKKYFLGLFLFPNNECVKTDGSQLLCLLLYNEYIMRLSEKYTENYNQLNISLPYIIVSKMKLPFLCKSHWKISRHRRSDMSGKL